MNGSQINLTKVVSFLILILIGSIVLSGAVSAVKLTNSTQLKANDSSVSATSMILKKVNNSSTVKPIVKKLVSSINFGIPSNPYIYGNKVVFMGSDATPDFNVYLWNMQTRTITPLSDNKDMWEGGVRISGNNVVWLDSTPPGSTLNPGSQIVYQDLSTGHWDILSSTSSAEYPSIYGSTVVWDCLSSNGTRRVVCVGGPGKTYQGVAYGHSADVYGNNVVYIDERNNIFGLYDYNIATGFEKLLSSTSAGSASNPPMSNPRIYDQKIVWADSRYGDADILMYDSSN